MIFSVRRLFLVSCAEVFVVVAEQGNFGRFGRNGRGDGRPSSFFREDTARHSHFHSSTSSSYATFGRLQLGGSNDNSNNVAFSSWYQDDGDESPSECYPAKRSSSAVLRRRSETSDGSVLAAASTEMDATAPAVLPPKGIPSSRKMRLASLRVHRRSEASSSETMEEDTSSTSAATTESLTQPLIATDSWEAMTGSEFENPEAVNKLARSGLFMATQDGNENPWVEWKPTKDTEKALEQGSSLRAMLEDGTVAVYIGKAKEQSDGGSYFGSHLPIIKSQSILPLSAEEVADLLMDSSRVKVYNKISLGRDDIKVMDDKTKIVRNLTQPPVAKSNMLSITLMHSRRLNEQDGDLVNSMKDPITKKSIVASSSSLSDGYLVVSRAVPAAASPDDGDLVRNDILLGVNLLQEIGPNECLMTAVTHVYSPSLPTMLASRFGVKGAVNFVNDVRGTVVGVSN